MSERVVLRPGATVAAGGRHYRMHQVLDLETALVHDSQTGELKRLKIGDLTPVALPAETSPSTGDVDLVGISNAAWQTAQERFAVIRPLLSPPAAHAPRWRNVPVVPGSPPQPSTAGSSGINGAVVSPPGFLPYRVGAVVKADCAVTRRRSCRRRSKTRIGPGKSPQCSMCASRFSAAAALPG